MVQSIDVIESKEHVSINHILALFLSVVDNYGVTSELARGDERLYSFRK